MLKNTEIIFVHNRTGDQERDFAPSLATFFMVLFLVYYINDTSTVAINLPLFFWALALFAAVYQAPTLILLIALLYFGMLFLFYFIGFALGVSQFVSLEYAPQILTGFASCSWIMSILAQRNRVRITDRRHIALQRLFIVGIAPTIAVSVNYFNIHNIADTREIFGFSYLTTSDLAAFFGIAVLSRERIGGVEFIFVAFSIVAVIIFLGSRSGLVFYALAVLFAAVYKFSLPYLIAFACAAAASLFLLPQLPDILDSPFLFRVSTLVDVLLGLDNSTSMRSVYFSDFLDQFESGFACVVIGCHAPSGSYVHSIFSVAQYFGIFAFLVTIFIFILAVANISAMWRNRLLPLFVLVALSNLFARAWMSVPFSVFVGVSLFFVFRNLMCRRAGRRVQDAKISIVRSGFTRRVSTTFLS